MSRAKIAAAVGALLMLAGVTACGADRQQATAASVTDPAVKKSDTATKFVIDLYNSPTGGYWRTKPQSAVFAQAAIFCATGGDSSARSDVKGNFAGSTVEAVDDYVRLAEVTVCPVLRRNGGTVPDYSP